MKDAQLRNKKYGRKLLNREVKSIKQKALYNYKNKNNYP